MRILLLITSFLVLFSYSSCLLDKYANRFNGDVYLYISGYDTVKLELFDNKHYKLKCDFGNYGFYSIGKYIIKYNNIYLSTDNFPLYRVIEENSNRLCDTVKIYFYNIKDLKPIKSYLSLYYDNGSEIFVESDSNGVCIVLNDSFIRLNRFSILYNHANSISYKFKRKNTNIVHIYLHDYKSDSEQILFFEKLKILNNGQMLYFEGYNTYLRRSNK